MNNLLYKAGENITESEADKVLNLVITKFVVHIAVVRVGGCVYSQVKGSRPTW